MKPLIVLFFFALFGTIRAQEPNVQVLSVDFEEVGLQISNPKSPYYYPGLWKKFINLDTNVGKEEAYYLYYGFVFHKKYNPYFASPLESSFYESVNEGNFREAINLGQKILKTEKLNLRILLHMISACRKAENHDLAQKYQKWFTLMMNAIYGSGDGQSRETAFVIIQVADEYAMLDLNQQQMVNQRLIHFDTDVLEVISEHTNFSFGKNKSLKQSQTIYFNVYQCIAFLQRNMKQQEYNNDELELQELSE